jgi:pimeloyl-ACP methyl ester carboxylesterase
VPPPITSVRPASEGFVDAGGGTRLWYRVRGSGPDTLIVPLGTLLEPSLAPLASQFTLVLYDPRQRLRSDPIPEAAQADSMQADSTRADSTQETFANAVRDLEAVRQALGISRASVIGYDYLAGVALGWAAWQPQRVNRVVLLSPIELTDSVALAYDPPERLARLDTALARGLVKLRAAGRDTTDPVGYCRAFWRVNAPLFVGDTTRAALVNPTWCEFPHETPARLARHLSLVLGSLGPARDFRQLARQVRAPVLVVQGERDLVVNPAGAGVWARALPSARVVMLPGVGHLPFLEAPGPLLQELTAFLRQ